MFSSAIVVFREVFEIVLIVGIILAATRAMPHRGKAVFGGLLAGIAGAVLVALFMDRISVLAQGMGQEFFSALVLFAAALFIGWTVLWMKRHARDMKTRFATLGKDVAEGRASYLRLSAVIALAILREGSEIILFFSGMLASGQPLSSLLAGSFLGMAGGLALGAMIYGGLVTLSLRLFFQITSWLLVFLVAGMMSQAMGFLVAAGLFGNISGVVWNSSWLLDDSSLIGQGLGTLIGYTARPTLAQLVVYIASIGVLFFLMKSVGRQPVMAKSSAVAAVIFFALFSFSSPAMAGEKISSPYVTQGELELEYKGAYATDDDSDENGAWKQKASLGYGITSRWKMEVEAETEKSGESGADPELSALTWENTLQLTEKGEYWVDTGLKGEYERNLTGGPDKIEGKLLLGKDAGKFTHRANIIIEKEVGAEAGDDTAWGFALGIRYRYAPSFEPGLEWYSNFEDIGHEGSFDEQNHRLGPVFYGRLGQAVKYEVGYLFGLSDSAPDGTAKLILEYEWHI